MAEAATYHEQHQKDGTVRFYCDVCDWWTPDMANLQQHARQQHQGVMVAGEPTTEPEPEEGEEDVPEPPEHPHGTPPGNRPDVPPGQEDQPGNRPDVPPGQDTPKPDDVPHPAHPIAEPDAVGA